MSELGSYTSTGAKELLEDELDDIPLPLQSYDRSSSKIASQGNRHLASLNKTVRTGVSAAKQIYVFGKNVIPVVSIVSQLVSGLYISTYFALPLAKRICNDSSHLPREYALQCSSFELLNQISVILIHSSCVLSVSLAYECTKAIINRSIKTVANVSNYMLNIGKNIYHHFYPIPEYGGIGFCDCLPHEQLKEKTHFEKFKNNLSNIPRHNLEKVATQLYALVYSAPLGRAIPTNEINPEFLFWRQACKDARVCRLNRKIRKAT